MIHRITELVTNPDREGVEPYCTMTSCYVRARNTRGGWGSYDIAELTRESLKAWLRSRDGSAERLVIHLLGYETEE